MKTALICTKLTVDGLTWGAWDPLVTVELAWVTMTFWGEASLPLCCRKLEPVQKMITILPIVCIICTNNQLKGILEEQRQHNLLIHH